MSRSAKAKKGVEIKTERQQVLPKEARAYANEVAADPVRAVDFLQRAGIINKAGKLAAPYR